ncbi:hypothetical protein LV85_04214 [Algoriphagus chordae]|uniref:Uncharacterized protein n=1 Tax=Algoriphagus chordae TaxID=237019 RepID=A0A2W7QCZ9_9BACT|nr:hypothetical protein LV85_04214 [Algoriphagus chordae]
MSFQTYINNIEGKTAEDLQKLAEEKGFTNNGVLVAKATEITN